MRALRLSVGIAIYCFSAIVGAQDFRATLLGSGENFPQPLHVVGFPGLWLGGWVFWDRDHPLRVFGPEGTANMIEHLTEAFSFDIGIRISDDRASPEGVKIDVTEVEDGFIWRDGNVAIRAIKVDHRPVEPAFGYRVDYDSRSVPGACFLKSRRSWPFTPTWSWGTCRSWNWSRRLVPPMTGRSSLAKTS